MGRRRRLAICIGAFEYGGQGTIIEEEVRHLRDDFDIVLFTERAERALPEGGSIELTSPWGSRSLLNKDLSRRLAEFDVIHCVDSLGLMAVAERTARPLVVTSVGIAPLLRRNTIRSAMEGAVTRLTYPALYRRAAMVIAISDYIGDWVKRAAGCRVEVIPLGTAVVEPGPQPASRSLLYVGEISRRKGIKDLLDGLASCPADVMLDLAGRAVGSSEALIEQHPAVGQVRFHAVMTTRQLGEHMKRCFATCSASLWEGFGLPILEGFGFGRPTIVRRQGGMHEQVEKSGGGSCFVSPGELGSRIEFVEQHWQELSDHALAYAAENTWAHTFGRYRNVFRSFADA